MSLLLGFSVFVCGWGGGGRKETKCLLVGNFGFYVKHLGIRMGDFSFIQVNDGCLVKSC